MKMKFGVLCLILAALSTIGTAIAHLSCLYFGPACYAAQLAPPVLIESAENGTYLAPLANLFVSSIFIVWGLFALSAAGLMRQLPFLKFCLYAIAAVCVIRGVLPLQLWLRYPERVDDATFYFGLAWLITGLLFAVGYQMRHSK